MTFEPVRFPLSQKILYKVYFVLLQGEIALLCLCKLLPLVEVSYRSYSGASGDAEHSSHLNHCQGTAWGTVKEMEKLTSVQAMIV